jgi:hypothetical protein
MPNRQIAPSDLRATAQQLLRTGTMPKLNDLLGVISSVRTKYVPQIKEAQSKGAAADEKDMEPLVKDATPAPDEFATGGGESPVPPEGDLTQPVPARPAESLLLGGRGGVSSAPFARGAKSFVPPSGPLEAIHGPKI